jgi:hypothetical protein
MLTETDKRLLFIAAIFYLYSLQLGVILNLFSVETKDEPTKPCLG